MSVQSDAARPAPGSRRHDPVLCRDVLSRFGQLLDQLVEEDAMWFALELAKRGLTPERLLEAAEDWEAFAFQPDHIAQTIRILAGDTSLLG